MITSEPSFFSTPIAARLMGVSIATFNAMGLPPWQFSRVHKRYTRQTIERALGRPITLDMVATAKAAHAPRLKLYADANSRRKQVQHAHP